MHSKLTRLLPCAALLAATAAGLVPQALLAQDRPPVFTEGVEVHVVNIEAFVTDADGLPVTDLAAEDFELRVDGEPVEITNFYATSREGGVATDASEISSPGEDRTPSQHTATQAVSPESQPFFLLVYFDNLNLRPANRQRVIDDLAGFLEDRLRLGDRVMVVAFNRSLEVIEPFTQSPERLEMALEALRKAAAPGIPEETRMRLAQRQIERALTDPLTQFQARDILDRYREESRLYLQEATTALTSAVRSMAGLPGRKGVLYVGEGLSEQAGGELLVYFGEVETHRETELFSRIVREANAQQVTLYTLDARGSTASSSLSAEFRGHDTPGGGVGGENPTVFDRSLFDATRTQNSQGPLITLAEATGGQAILNTSNFDDALKQLGRDASVYYSLGFKPAKPRDGSFHRVAVLVKRPGIEVRHRSGFVDKPLTEAVADRVHGAVLAGLGSNPLAISVQFDRPQKKKGDLHLPMLVRVPIKSLALLPGNGTFKDQLRFYILVQDEEGRLSKVQEVPYPVRVAADDFAAAREQDIAYLAELRIRPGTQKIGIGVLDENGRTESYLQQVVLVEDPDKKGGKNHQEGGKNHQEGGKNHQEGGKSDRKGR